MNASSGYIGWSMSRRALEAYENGEMPKSKWTKKAMVTAIKDACDDLDLVYDPAIEKMKKDDLFHTFLYNSSWHHTGKFFNETDFYAIDEDALADRFPEMSDRQLAERKAARAAERQAIEEERMAREAEENERRNLRREYEEEHGFAPTSVAAFAHEHPECCEERISRKGNHILAYIDYMGIEKILPIEHVKGSTLHGYDATVPDSFKSAIESYRYYKAEKEYEPSHGFPPNSMAALAYEHPEKVCVWKASNGDWMLAAQFHDFIGGKVATFCRLEDATRADTYGYSVLAPHGVDVLDARVADPDELISLYPHALAPGTYEDSLRSHFATEVEKHRAEKAPDAVTLKREASSARDASEKLRHPISSPSGREYGDR